MAKGQAYEEIKKRQFNKNIYSHDVIAHSCVRFDNGHNNGCSGVGL